LNILIVKLSAIGDVIHTLPSLAALRRRYPEAHITWVVEEAAADLIVGHPYLDRVLVFHRKSWFTDLKKGKFAVVRRDFKSFVSDIQSRSYDLVIDFHGLLKSSVIVFFSKGKRKLGYDSWQECSRLFYTERIPEDMNKHAVDRYLDFLRYLGAAAEPAEFVLPVTGETQARVESLMARHHLTAKKFIAISPVALWDTKLWSDSKFARLADNISQKLNIPVVFTGRDKESLDKITSQMTTNAINIGGQTSLTELAAFYKNALTVITTDSGPMHLAAAAGIPVVALFGPTNPARTGPYGADHIIVRAGLHCSPCLKKQCATRQCMEDITPEQVLAAVQKILQKPAHPEKKDL
jgi:3-deoxy-D-manno-octulosonic-acid transferase/heptosyltransferase-1